MFQKGLFRWSAFSTITILVLMLILKEFHSISICNVAQKKRVYMSRREHDFYGKYAVDGIPLGIVAHATSTGDPWIVVDLGRPHKIERMEIYKCNMTCGNHKYLAGFLNNFDEKKKSDYRTQSIQCTQGNNNGNLTHFDCSTLVDYYRYIVIQSSYTNYGVAVSEIIAFGYSYVYIGCFKKISDSVDTNSKIENVIDCFNSCPAGKDYFATLKNGACSCAMRYEESLSVKECNKQCTTPNTDYCGGGAAYSVYKEGIAESDSDYHCKHNTPLNNELRCENGLCEGGWIGDACSERDCSVDNGGCRYNKCNKVVMPTGPIAECVCVDKAFVKKTWWQNCNDVDKCKEANNSCNLEIASCTNIVGSYTCDCKNGATYDYQHNTCLGDLDVVAIATIAAPIAILFLALIVILLSRKKKKFYSFGTSGSSFSAGSAGTAGSINY